MSFWGEQKPLKHYFEHGVISFSVRNGELWYQVKLIEKAGNYPLFKNKVQNKEHLDIILGGKTIDDYPYMG